MMTMSSRNKSGLVVGISGQDGSYMADLLSEKGYDVYGAIAGHNLEAIVKKLKPNEIYHLAAMNNVRRSYEEPVLTMDVNARSYFSVLQAARHFPCKIFYACSSEIFGIPLQTPQTENTPPNPQSPYAISKTSCLYMSRVYRKAYGMSIYTGILYNHESPRRREEFFSKKVCKYVASVAKGNTIPLQLGSISSSRDWGWAPEYVEYMHKMLQEAPPDDYIMCTGETHSVKEFIKEAFSNIGIEEWEKYITFEDSLVRPNEVDKLVGDYSKAKEAFGFEPKIRFKEIVRLMVEAELNKQ